MIKFFFKFAKKPLTTTLTTVVNPHKTTRVAASFVSNFLIKFLCSMFLLIVVLIFFKDGFLKFMPSFKKDIKVGIYFENKSLAKDIFENFNSNSYKLEYKIFTDFEEFKNARDWSDVLITFGKDFNIFEENNILFPIENKDFLTKKLSNDLSFNGFFGNYVSLCKFYQIPVNQVKTCSGDNCEVKNIPLENSILIGKGKAMSNPEFSVIMYRVLSYCKENKYL